MSKVNREMVKMAYHEDFDSISVFAMDNVALNGLAMFSVLRNQCGQSTMDSDDDTPACGQDLIMPQMTSSQHLPVFWNIVLFLVYGSLLVIVATMLYQAFKLRNRGSQDHRVTCNGQLI